MSSPGRAASGNPRHLAARAATERRPRTFERPTGPDGRPLPVREFFGCNTFGLAQMREHLPADVVRTFSAALEEGRPLERDTADRIAGAALEWALQRGVTHFCHWFHPMTGSTAEKHDAFLAFDDERPISKFTGAQLVQGEPDASSFPSGGIRSTFEARGYTAWDPSSPMFIVERTNGATLCIPCAFVSYHGEALDKKTPLLRSMNAICRESVRLLHLLGDTDVRRVVVTAGPEQEYFLVDKAWVAFRPDLVAAGRTVVGAPPAKGQSLDDHYFGTIPTRVLAFMHELETELYKLGVPATTRHNEVAPSQFELAVLYREANVAADHNQLVMELIRKVAARHDFAALLHEKPFAGVNGSGKHLNWSLADDRGRNLLDPGDHPADDLRFLAFLAATLLGVHRHARLLRCSVGSHGNDFRLGAHEAPPAIISAFLGSQLSAVCDALLADQAHEEAEVDDLELGVDHMPAVARDSTDRNRTSPFAFTGNKFEFRALGSAQSVSFPLTCLNTAVADALREISDLVERTGDPRGAIREALRRADPVRFDGDNYAPEWVTEAARRGLPNLRTAAHAAEALRDPATVELFTRHEVLSEKELASRHLIELERYLTKVEIDVNVIRQLVDQLVMPAALAERGALARDLAALRQVIGELTDDELEPLTIVNGLVADLRAARRALDEAVAGAQGLDEERRAHHYADAVMPAVAALRRASDALEARIADERWPLPRYGEMIFQHA